MRTVYILITPKMRFVPNETQNAFFIYLDCFSFFLAPVALF